MKYIKHMRQYIYSRVSTDKQATENQIHQLRALYPEAEVVEEYISGAKDHKPALKGLIDRMVKGDILVVAALDRLGRTAYTALKLLADLDKRGIAVVSVREGIDYTTSTGKMVAGMLLVIAQNERDLISERTKQALKRLKDAGVQLGCPNPSPESLAKRSASMRATMEAKKAAGYKPGPKVIKADSAVVLRIKSLRSEGLSMRSIASVVGLSAGRVCQLLKERV
jgi:DNA invertase Pin-like site-specific DNA recombinase